MPAVSPAVFRSLSCPDCGTPLDPAVFGTGDPLKCSRCRTVLRGAVFPALWNPEPAGEGMAARAIEGESVCFFHPQNRAVLSCERCGRFVCAVCDLPVGSRHLCPACLSSGVESKKLPEVVPSRFLWADTALIIGVLPLLVSFPFWPVLIITGPAAIGLALFGWRRPGIVVRGRHRWMAVLGILFGLAQIAVWVAMVGFIWSFSRR